VFAIQYGLTQVWRSWGVQPDIVVGHSLGEFAAAFTAGVLTLPDALHLIAERGRLMDSLPAGGGMAALQATRSQAQELCDGFPGELWIAAVNAPDQVVVSGHRRAIDAACMQLAAGAARARTLAIPVAAHSPLLAPILDEFERSARSAVYGAPALPVVSTTTGELMKADTCSARYFRDQLRSPVEFARAMQTLAAQGARVFVEIGPHPVLLGPAAACTGGLDEVFVASQSRERDQLRQLLEAALELHAAGIDLDWAALPGAHGAHDPEVPTYSFTRRRYWIAARGRAFSERLASAAREDEPSAAPSRAEDGRRIESDGIARLQRLIKEELRRILGLDRERGDAELDRSFGELGLSSLGAVQLRSCVQRWSGKPLPATFVSSDKTAHELAAEAWAYMKGAA
jgi:acyl transferase domain-containing protein